MKKCENRTVGSNPYQGNKAGVHKAPQNVTAGDPKCKKITGGDLRANGNGKKGGK